MKASGQAVFLYSPKLDAYRYPEDCPFKTSRARLARSIAASMDLLPFYKHGEGSGVTPAQDAEEIQVEAVTIPDFLSTHHIRKVDFINLDCEGSELLIFRNAAAWLKKEAPPIFCEVHRQYMKALGHSVGDAVTFLSGLGYDVRPIQVEDVDTPSDFERCSHIYATHASHNRQSNNQKREIG